MSKVGEVLKFRDAGLSVEDARKAMFAAGEAPKGLNPLNIPAASVVPVVPEVVPVAAVDALEPELEEEEVIPTPTKPVPVAVAPVSTPVVPRVERIETSQFVGEIKQEGGKWVAELRYKTGGGTERFVKNTKNDLMLALLEGKGHATLRVHKAVRREKLGWSELDRQYPLPEWCTTKDFEEMSDKQQNALLYTIASEQIVMFNDAHPEFYKTPKNAQALNDFLTEHKLPITLRNLEYAFEDLQETDQENDKKFLDYRPVVEPAREVPPSSALVPAPVQTDSAPATAAPAVAPATVSVAAVPAVTVRKRGTTGLQPGQSSSASELGGLEDGGTPREPSEAELRRSEEHT